MPGLASFTRVRLPVMGWEHVLVILLADAETLVRESPIGFAVAFGGGALSFFSPCVLPLVPGYLSLMSGVSTAELAAVGGRRGGGVSGALSDASSDGMGLPKAPPTARILRSTLLFVAGFTLAFTVLGLTVLSSVRTLGIATNTLDVISGALIVVMGLFLAGVVSSQTLMRERRFHVSPSKLGPFAAPVMGMAFAVGWTPCIGPILTGVLGLAATGTPVRGTVMLVFYSMGLGVPFVVTGLLFSRMTTAFGWVKRHFRIINLVSGILLAGFGLLLMTHNLHVLSADISRILRALGLSRLASS